MTEWGIDTLFNPGKRHMDEEKRRLQSTREEVGDSSGGRRVDFKAGKVTIARRGAPAAASDPDSAEAPEAKHADEPAEDAVSGDAVTGDAVTEGAATEGHRD